MNKKSITLCLLLILMLILPLSAVNMQKIFPIESDVYEALTFLYMEQGKSVPSSSGPWSADELMKMLDRINRASLSPGGRNTYDYVQRELAEPPKSQPSNSFGYSFGLDVALEGYMHTNIDDPGFFTDERDWVNDFETRDPFLNIPFETWATDMFYGYFALPITINQFGDTNETASVFNHSFTTNVFLVPPNELMDLNRNIPYRAFASAGGEHWNLQLGRDRVSWGSGQTGNLMIGGHMQYNDFLKFTTYHNTYKFTSIAMAFPHPLDYGYGQVDVSGDPTGVIGEPDGQDGTIDGIRMYIGHRLEFKFLDIINITVTEGLMYMSEDNSFDFRLLNPLSLYHNTNNSANSNSIFGLDIEVNPWENISVYGQFVIDELTIPEFQFPAPPNASGFLGGIKAIIPLKQGTLYGGLETAYTDPYLYLRSSDGTHNQQIGEYGVNYVVGIREFSAAENVSIMEDFLGYEYGNDAIVLNLNGGYTVFDKFRVEGNIFYMMHGTHDMYTLWEKGISMDSNDPSIVTTPTSDPASDNHIPISNTRGSVEHTLKLGLKGSYNILDNFKVYGQVDWLHKINPGNFSTNDPESDLQISLGAAYSL